MISPPSVRCQIQCSSGMYTHYDIDNPTSTTTPHKAVPSTTTTTTAAQQQQDHRTYSNLLSSSHYTSVSCNIHYLSFITESFKTHQTQGTVDHLISPNLPSKSFLKINKKNHQPSTLILHIINPSKLNQVYQIIAPF